VTPCVSCVLWCSLFYLYTAFILLTTTYMLLTTKCIRAVSL
jgi:hypothetical protein